MAGDKWTLPFDSAQCYIVPPCYAGDHFLEEVR